MVLTNFGEAVNVTYLMEMILLVILLEIESNQLILVHLDLGTLNFCFEILFKYKLEVWVCLLSSSTIWRRNSRILKFCAMELSSGGYVSKVEKKPKSIWNKTREWNHIKWSIVQSLFLKMDLKKKFIFPWSSTKWLIS